MEIPQRVPVRIEYRKRDRVAVSLCFVLAQSGGLLWCAGTLDGDQPLGLVTISERDVRLAVRLDDGAVIGGRG